MIIEKLKSNHYLQSTIVLAIDTIASLFASLMVLLFCVVISRGPEMSREFVLTWSLASLASSVIAFYFTRIYRLIIRYSTLREVAHLTLGVVCKEAMMLVVMLCATSMPAGAKLMLVLMDLMATLAMLIIVRVLMLVAYRVLVARESKREHCVRVLVYGVSEKSASIITRMRNSPHYRVEGFLDYGEKEKNNLLVGLPVYHFTSEDELSHIKIRHDIEGILFAYHQDARNEQDRLVNYAHDLGLKLFMAPSIDEIPENGIFASGIRKIRIEDLLGRSEIKISMDLIRQNFAGKRVLVTGAAGSIGSELCRQLAQLGVGELIMFDNAETPLHNVRLEFEDTYPDLKFTPIIGDVRLIDRLDFVFRTYHPQVVFHAAAYKHVPLMEENPCEAVLVNVAGSRNVANKCVEYEAERMVMVSTDKAVNPTNIMGCTKRLAEIYVQSLGLAIENGTVKGKTTFVTTRFGNVLGSNGSVIPRFTEQIEKGGPVTVTDPEIRRFFMTIPEACRLVMEAATMAKGTQIFVFDMGQPIKIADLAKRMIKLAGYEVDKDIKIEYTGLRPGEKLYEEVLATKENTIPTDHRRIFVAKVREYSNQEANRTVSELEELSRKVQIPEMVMLMKKTVPEFKSKHSPFEIYDKD